MLSGWWFQFFLFSPLFGEDFHFDYYFSEGLVQPPTSYDIDSFSDFLLVFSLIVVGNYNTYLAASSYQLVTPKWRVPSGGSK